MTTGNYFDDVQTYRYEEDGQVYYLTKKEISDRKKKREAASGDNTTDSDSTAVTQTQPEDPNKEITYEDINAWNMYNLQQQTQAAEQAQEAFGTGQMFWAKIKDVSRNLLGGFIASPLTFHNEDPEIEMWKYVTDNDMDEYFPYDEHMPDRYRGDSMAAKSGRYYWYMNMGLDDEISDKVAMNTEGLDKPFTLKDFNYDSQKFYAAEHRRLEALRYGGLYDSALEEILKEKGIPYSLEEYKQRAGDDAKSSIQALLREKYLTDFHDTQIKAIKSDWVDPKADGGWFDDVDIKDFIKKQGGLNNKLPFISGGKGDTGYEFEKGVTPARGELPEGTTRPKPSFRGLGGKSWINYEATPEQQIRVGENYPMVLAETDQDIIDQKTRDAYIQSRKKTLGISEDSSWWDKLTGNQYRYNEEWRKWYQEFAEAAREDDSILQAADLWLNNRKYTWTDMGSLRFLSLNFAEALPSNIVSMGAFLGGAAAGAGVSMATAGPDPTDVVTFPAAFASGYATVGGSLATLLSTYSMEGGGMYNEVINYFDDPENAEELTKMYGKDYKLVKEAVAGELAYNTGVPNALIELLPTNLLMSRLGVGKQLNKQILHQTVGKKWIKDVGLKRMIWHPITQGAAEGMEEIMQTSNELMQWSRIRDVDRDEIERSLRKSWFMGFIGGKGTSFITGGTVGNYNYFADKANIMKMKKKGIEIYTDDYINQNKEQFQDRLNGDSLEDDNLIPITLTHGETKEEQKFWVTPNAAITIVGSRNPIKVWDANENKQRTVTVADLQNDDWKLSDKNKAEFIEALALGELLGTITREQADTAKQEMNEDPDIETPDITIDNTNKSENPELFGALQYVRNLFSRNTKGKDATIVGDDARGGTSWAGQQGNVVSSILRAAEEHGAAFFNSLDNEVPQNVPIGNNEDGSVNTTAMTEAQWVERIISAAVENLNVGNAATQAGVVKSIYEGTAKIKQEVISTGSGESVAIPILEMNEADVLGLVEEGDINEAEGQILLQNIAEQEEKILAKQAELEQAEESGGTDYSKLLEVAPDKQKATTEWSLMYQGDRDNPLLEEIRTELNKETPDPNVIDKLLDDVKAANNKRIKSRAPEANNTEEKISTNSENDVNTDFESPIDTGGMSDADILASLGGEEAIGGVEIDNETGQPISGQEEVTTDDQALQIEEEIRQKEAEKAQLTERWENLKVKKKKNGDYTKKAKELIKQGQELDRQIFGLQQNLEQLGPIVPSGENVEQAEQAAEEELNEIDNTQPDNTAPEQPNLENLGDEDISAGIDDIVAAAKDVASSAGQTLADVLSSLGALITPEPIYSKGQLDRMGERELQKIAASIAEREQVPYDSISTDKKSLIEFIMDNQGQMTLFSGIGFVMTEEQMKRFKVNMKKAWESAKKTGLAMNVFAQQVKKQLIEKHGKDKGTHLGNAVDQWYDSESKNVEDLSHLGFSNSLERKTVTQDDLTLHRIFSGERLSDIMSDEKLNDDIEEQGLTDDTDFSSNTFSFSAKHIHSMNDKIKMDVFGIITKEEYNRLISMAQEAETRENFINGIDKLLQDNGQEPLNQDSKDKVGRFWVLNQKINKIATHHLQRFVVMQEDGKWGIRPRPEKLYGKEDAKFTVASFVEMGLDGLEDKQITKKLAIVSLADFFQKKPDGTYNRSLMPDAIDKKWLYNEHIRLAELGWAIVGVKATTSPSLILARVEQSDMDTAQNFLAFMKSEKSIGNIDEVDLRNYENTWNQYEIGSIPIERIAQEVAAYRMMQAMRFDGILGQGPSVPNIFKRLALDLSNGVVPVGLGNYKILSLSMNDMEVRDANGNTVDHFMVDGKKYKFDGHLFTSTRFLKKLGGILGMKNLTEAKGVIRYKDAKGNYITVKSQWMTPPGGFTIHNSLGQMVASFESVKINTEGSRFQQEIIIRDKNGNQIDFVGTEDEIKNLSGNDFMDLKNESLPIELPESSLRLKSTIKNNKHTAPFPNLWLELLTDAKDDEIRKEISEYLYTEIVTRFLAGEQGLFSIFGDHKNAKYIKRLVMEIGARDGGVPSQVEKFISNIEAGFGHPIFKNGLKSVIKNKIIIDRVFSARLPSTGTLGVFASDVDSSVGRDEFQAGIMNKFIRQQVLEQYLLATPEAMAEVAALQEKHGPVRGTNKWIKEKGGMDGVVDILNEFLETNEINYFQFRNPINQKTEARVKRLTRVLPEGRGNVIVNNAEDTFGVHLADHDGDEGMLIAMPSELLLKLKKHLQESIHYAIDLQVFKKPGEETRFSNANQRFEAMSANTSSLGAVGQIVNLKRVRGVLSIKGLSQFMLTRRHKGRKVYTRVELRKPDDKVIMWYAPLSDNEADLVGLDPRVNIIEHEGEKYIETTSEHEMGILVNAATDNPQYGFLGHWGVDNKFLMSRIFKKVEKNGTEKMGFKGKGGEILNPLQPEQFFKNEIKSLRILVNRYKYGTILQGRSKDRINLELSNIVNISKNLNSLMEDENGKLEKLLNSEINYHRQDPGKSDMPHIRGIKVNGKRVLAEELIMSIYKQQEKYAEDNPTAKYWGEDFMSDIPFRVQQSNKRASEVLGEKSYMNKLIKKYNITEQDFIKAKTFLEKLLFGDSAFNVTTGKYEPMKTQEIQKDGETITVPVKPGFYYYFTQLHGKVPENMKQFIAKMNKTKQTLDGYTYDEGMAQLIEDFIDEFWSMSQGAQAAVIHSFMVGAKVGKTMSKGKIVPMTPVRPSQLTQILPAEFMSVGIEGDVNNRDFTIMNDWFKAWQDSIENAELPVKKVDWTKETYGNLQELFNC